MSGEKPTRKALQFTWQGAKGPADSIHEPCQKKVAVIGIGDIGNNIVTELTNIGIKGALTLALNSDSPQLSKSSADQKILLGTKSLDDVKSWEQMERILAKMEVIFLAAGLEDVKRTDATLRTAKIGKQLGAITLGVVAKPLTPKKQKNSSNVPTELLQTCDTVAVIDTGKLSELSPQMTTSEIRKVVGQMLANMIKSIVEAISSPCLKNLDFADFRAIMEQGGNAMIGIGESDASNRVEEAVSRAWRNPLLSNEYARAKGALVQITGDSRLTIEEADRVGKMVTKLLKEETQVIWGANVDPELEGKIRVTLVMTGLDAPRALGSFTSMIPELFNLESDSEPEKTLPINLGLYQLENFES